MYIKYPSVTKIIWETKPTEVREKIGKFSKKEYKDYSTKQHKNIEDNKAIVFNNTIIDIKAKYGEKLYEEKFFRNDLHKYCGKIDFFSKEYNLVEWKFVQREKSISLALPDYQLQIGAYYQFLRRFPQIKGTLVIFAKDTGNIIEYHYDKAELVAFKKLFLVKLKQYYAKIM